MFKSFHTETDLESASHCKTSFLVCHFLTLQVYAYDVQADGCCVDGYPKPISEAYPGQYPYISALPDDIDAAYYSIKHKKVFFFKGSLYWENVTFNPSFTTVLNKVGLSAEWNTRWNDICNIE